MCFTLLISCQKLKIEGEKLLLRKLVSGYVLILIVSSKLSFIQGEIFKRLHIAGKIKKFFFRINKKVSLNVPS